MHACCTQSTVKDVRVRFVKFFDFIVERVVYVWYSSIIPCSLYGKFKKRSKHTTYLVCFNNKEQRPSINQRLYSYEGQLKPSGLYFKNSIIYRDLPVSLSNIQHDEEEEFNDPDGRLGLHVSQWCQRPCLS